ncbi:Major Facilitator Superfamily (MFS) [Thraustotheca clavata]|uniref:Major Facilitator Superfamily (MFS) n=1 Tax=Thraustotheca clavata TaxID=74557 RepID=A0A1V9ZVH5_9STRA|nr:Major Facilitator Superfamily (MFS) [Thraustotheca clavata]
MVEITRPLSIAAGAIIFTSLGSSYAISAWNNQLKCALNMTQPEIAFVSLCYSFGMYTTILAGVFHDRFGTKLTMLFAFMLLCPSYAMASYLSTRPLLPKWYIALCFGAIGQAGGFAIVAGLAANEGIYGDYHRGTIVGFLMAVYSAGGALFAYIYHGVFDNRINGYFEFMSIEHGFMCIFGLLFLIPPKSLKQNNQEDVPLLPSPVKDITLQALLTDIRFWLLFVPVMIGVGSALFVLNNIAFIVESAGVSLHLVPIYVSTFSMCNMFGRFLMGFLSDYFAAAHSRAWFLSCGVVFMAITQLIFLLCPVEYLWLPIACSGLAEGFIYSMFPVVTRELFGNLHFGKNFGLISLANAVGFPLILGPLSSLIYREASQGDKCFGSQCFSPMYLVIFCMCLLALWSSIRLQRYMPQAV